MKNHEENFEPKEPKVEEIDMWTPIVTTPEDSIIQLFQSHTRNYKVPPEEVDAWIAVSQELMRQEIARLLMKLYVISFFVGLVAFILTQNIWLLAACGLPLLIRWIIGYFFRQPKK